MTDSSLRAARDMSTVDVAIGILMAGHKYTPDEACALLHTAADEHDMSVSELAMCLVAAQELC
jgi:AmiR/NasT family two-component response regulator